MKEYDATTRTTIVTLRYVSLYTFAHIATLFDGVTAEGARALYNRAKHRANSDKLANLLQHVKDLPRPGAPPRAVPGGAVSKAVRTKIRTIKRY